MNLPHTYNARSAWAMLRYSQLAHDADIKSSAIRKLDWCLKQEKEGHYLQCAFTKDAVPYTHTIAYAIRGMWESGEILNRDEYRESAIRVAQSVISEMREDGFVPGQLGPKGAKRSSYCCLTGNCQLAIVWHKIYRATHNNGFQDGAKKALAYVMSQQDIKTADLNRHGAIKGSQPIWGRYAPFSYPNWATKFFIEAILECEEAA